MKFKEILHLPFKPFLKPYREMEEEKRQIEREFKNGKILIPLNIKAEEIIDYEKLREEFYGK